MSNYDPIIYGKSDILRIVSIEVHDNYAQLYIEEVDGEVREMQVPSKLWVLAHKNINNSMVKLKGYQYYLYGKQFATFKEFSDFRHKHYKNEIYTIHNIKENCMVNKGLTYYKGMKIDEVSVLSFDIETNGLKINSDSEVFLISNTFKRGSTTIKKLFSSDDYTSQYDMVEDWCSWVREVNPAILLGHNILSYDLPFLHNIATMGGLEGLPLGRDDSYMVLSEKPSKFRVDGSRDLHYNKSNIYGRELIDTMFLAYRYDLAKKYESYGLKPIIKIEGLESSDRTFYDAALIKDNWHIPEEREKIKEYAKDDADDALKLFYLMAPSVFYMTQSIPKPFQLMTETATGSQLNSLMVRAYLQNGYSIAKADDVDRFEGAYSWGDPGIYRNVFKIDVSSLYPSIMLQYDVFDSKKDPENYLKKVLDYFRTSRLQYKALAKETKDPYYSAMDQLSKIVINSIYGFMGATGLNYNYPRGAAEVTRNGREILAFCVRWATSKMITDFIKEIDEEEEDLDESA